MAFDLRIGGRALGAKFAGLGVATVVAFAISSVPGVALADEPEQAADSSTPVVEVATNDTDDDSAGSAGNENTTDTSSSDVATAEVSVTTGSSTQEVTSELPAESDEAAPQDVTTEEKAQPVEKESAEAGESDAKEEVTENETIEDEDKADSEVIAPEESEAANESTVSDAETVVETSTTTGAAVSTATTAKVTTSTTVPSTKTQVQTVAITSPSTTKTTTSTSSAQTTSANATVATASLATAESTEIVEPENVYRLYNPWSGEHLYTTSLNEATTLFTIGWQWESTAYQASASTGTAVYRLYNPYTSAHFYTKDENEYNSLGSIGWNKEGRAWYAFGDSSLYRLYNPYSSIGEHLYTTDSNERTTALRAGWLDEGIAWTVTPGFRSIAGQWIVSSAYGTQERYWIGSDTQLAKNRYVTPDEGTGYTVNAYATSSGAVVRNATRVGNGVMLADNEGRLASVTSGWLVTGTYTGGTLQRYYITNIGTAADGTALTGAQTGWFTVDGANYYAFYNLGYVIHNGVVGTDNNNIYEADNDGKLTKITNYKSSAWKYANNIGSGTGWFLTNDLTNYRAMVFRKYSDNDPWAMIEDFLCGYGDNTFMGLNSILGRFMTKDNGYQYTLYNTYYAYAPNEPYSTRWQMYHGSLYFSGSGDLAETGLGEKVSGGCIRLSDDNAKYIYDNVPDATPMYTYY